MPAAPVRRGNLSTDTLREHHVNREAAGRVMPLQAKDAKDCQPPRGARREGGTPAHTPPACLGKHRLGSVRVRARGMQKKSTTGPTLSLCALRAQPERARRTLKSESTGGSTLILPEN